MGKFILIILLFLPLVGCSTVNNSKSSDSFVSSSTKKNSEAYINKLKASSSHNHCYIHYYRYDNQPSSYSDWMVWAFNVGDDYGTRFDWKGRTQVDLNTVTGDADVDEAGAVVDIDLTRTYIAAVDLPRPNGTIISVGDNTFNNGSLMVHISRVTRNSGGTRNNDGESIFIELTNYKISLSDEEFSYHVFLLQSNTENPFSIPTFLD